MRATTTSLRRTLPPTTRIPARPTNRSRQSTPLSPGSSPATRYTFTKACIARAWSLIAPTPSKVSLEPHIRIVAWPNEVVEIKGSDVVTDWKKYDGGSPASTTAPAGSPTSKRKVYVKENWLHNTQQVFCDGKALTQIAGYVGEGYIQEAWEGRKGKSLADLEPGSFYYDRGARKLYLWLPGGEDPAKHVVEVQVRSGGISTCDLNWYDIAGFKVTHASAGIGGSFGSYNTLENMEVAYADFCGIGVGGSFNTLINCKSNYNGNTGISTFNRGHRVINCEVRFNNRRRWSAGWTPGA